MLLLLICLMIPGSDVVWSQGGELRVRYDVDEEGAPEAARVILMARRPGMAWSEVAEARRGETLRFRPEAEGLYQLAAVAIGVDGSREAPGDAAEATVVVDSTPPDIALHPEDLPGGAGLILRWEAKDSYLPADGVAVELGLGQAEASWKASGEGQVVLGEPRTGEIWTVRLVATDRAGNASEATFRYPVEVPVPELRDIAAVEPEEKEEPRASYARGRSLLSRREWAAAEKELRGVVERDPKDVRARQDLAYARMKLGTGTN
jgi:hypothetical protein